MKIEVSPILIFIPVVFINLFDEHIDLVHNYIIEIYQSFFNFSSFLTYCNNIAIQLQFSFFKNIQLTPLRRKIFTTRYVVSIIPDSTSVSSLAT